MPCAALHCTLSGSLNFDSCRWVAVVKEMREVFGRLEAQGYPRERQEVGFGLVPE